MLFHLDLADAVSRKGTTSAPPIDRGDRISPGREIVKVVFGPAPTPVKGSVQKKYRWTTGGLGWNTPLD